MKEIKLITQENKGKQEEVFLQRKLSGWKVVYPIKHPVTKKILWKNLLIGGSYWNILSLALIFGALIFLMWAYSHDINAIRNSCLIFKGSLGI